MSLFICSPIRFSLMLLISSLLVSGCGSPSDSDPADAQPVTDMIEASEDDVISDDVTQNSTGEMDDDATGTTDVSTTIPSIETIEVADESASGSIESGEPSLTRVNVDITVPVYVSNTLQVRLDWGDTDINADWVVDETWSASMEVGSNTEHQLLVTFSDDNGDLILGSYETNYRTGVEELEILQIQLHNLIVIVGTATMMA